MFENYVLKIDKVSVFNSRKGGREREREKAWFESIARYTANVNDIQQYQTSG